MISKYSHKGLLWIDLESPKEEEILYVLEEYSIPSFIKENLISGSKNDQISLEYGYIYISVNLPISLPNEKTENKLIFIANDKIVLMIHTEPIEATSLFLKEMELDFIGNEEKIINNKLLFAYLAKILYLNAQEQIIEKDIKIQNYKQKIIKINKKLRNLRILVTISIIVIILLYVIIYI
jgi:Mg2+ and Co2+ transporter CorA